MDDETKIALIAGLLLVNNDLWTMDEPDREEALKHARFIVRDAKGRE